jgi:two-component system sensor histidine kinase PhoQ
LLQSPQLAQRARQDPTLVSPRADAWAAVVFDGQVLWSTDNTPAALAHAPLKGFEFFQEHKGWFREPGRGTFSFATDPSQSHRLVLPLLSSLETEGASSNLSSGAPGAGARYLLVVGESPLESLDRLAFLHSTIWWGMVLSLLALLCAQAVAARWTTAPLRRLSGDLAAVRAGQRPRLDQRYPKEIAGVVIGFNELLDRETRQLVSHRHAMDNLAHSLKTPLAVLHSAAENDPDAIELRKAVRIQVARMDRQVIYHLSVAGRQGRAWRPPVDPTRVEPVAQGLAQSLEKLYAGKGALCEFDGLEGLTVPMEEDDLQEMLGNLLDNAFKWCRQRVLLSGRVEGHCVVLEVGDDGPGVPLDRLDDIRTRGRRADERMPGHGIGLAAVDDIIVLHSGHMEVGQHPELGGACFRVELPLLVLS